VKVVVTRAPGQAEPLASRIEELGHEVVLCPLIRIDRIGGDEVELT
jgi:uroporphyrinogen-III synthase